MSTYHGRDIRTATELSKVSQELTRVKSGLVIYMIATGGHETCGWQPWSPALTYGAYVGQNYTNTWERRQTHEDTG